MLRASDRPVCLFDSGIGGLTVLRKLAYRFPNENYVYLADLARVPFGDKTRLEMEGIAVEIIEWLSSFNPKLIIMACNTSSAILGSRLPALASRLNVPIYGMIKSCARVIAGLSYKKISVWATRLVVENNGYKRAINKLNKDIDVEEIACPKLVPMIEDLNLSSVERAEIICEYLDKTSKDTQAIVLGCTHYPLVKGEIKKLTSVDIIDPTDDLLSDLNEHLVLPSIDIAYNVHQISLYATAQVEKIQKFSSAYLGRCCEVTLASLVKTAV